MVVYNGANMTSAVTTSKPFLILKANVAGTVRDGRSRKDDLRYSHDKSVCFHCACSTLMNRMKIAIQSYVD
jgi:hypothetical protein